MKGKEEGRRNKGKQQELGEKEKRKRKAGEETMKEGRRERKRSILVRRTKTEKNCPMAPHYRKAHIMEDLTYESKVILNLCNLQK